MQVLSNWLARLTVDQVLRAWGFESLLRHIIRRITMKTVAKLFAVLILCVLFVCPVMTQDKVTPPSAVNVVHVVYPERALKAGLAGIVYVQVFINCKGDVDSAKVIKTTDVVFNESALTAAKQWKFKPATLNGQVIATPVVLPFKFALSN